MYKMKRREKLTLAGELTIDANSCGKKATMYATYRVGQPNTFTSSFN